MSYSYSFTIVKGRENTEMILFAYSHISRNGGTWFWILCLIPKDMILTIMQFYCYQYGNSGKVNREL